MARKNKKKKNRYTQVEKTAFMMGQVQRGLNNPDSRISSSYKNGLTPPERKKKRPLF